MAAKATLTAREFVYPREFRAACLEAAQTLHLAEPVAQRVAALRKQVDPAVLDAHPAAYTLPLPVARLLYIDGLPDSTAEVMAAVQNLHGKSLVSGVAAVTRDAVRAADWRLIGWLCARVDAAVGRSFDPVDDASRLAWDGREMRQKSPPESWPDTLGPGLLGQFKDLVRMLVDRPGQSCWAETVRGYLASLPASALPPTALTGLAWTSAQPPADAPSAPLLRLLVSVPAQWWRRHEHLQPALQGSPCAFVRDFVARQCQPPPENSLAEILPPLPEEAAKLPIEEDFLDAFVAKEDDPSQFAPPPEPEPQAAPVPEAETPQPAPSGHLRLVLLILAFVVLGTMEAAGLYFLASYLIGGAGP